MLETELNSWIMFEHVARYYADIEVVDYTAKGKTHAYTYGEFATRSQKLMHALDHLDLETRAPS
jgi:hypothetical protein